MADVEHRRIEEIDAAEGFFEGIKMHRVAADLGGKLFAKRPNQLGQEEVYVALRGSGTVTLDGEDYPLDPDHIVRIGPTVKRKVVAGPDGLRLLALGGIPGSPYEPAG